MHSDWFNEIEILQGRWQHGEKVGYCYHSGLEKTLCKWALYVPLVTKGLTNRMWTVSQWRAFWLTYAVCLCLTACQNVFVFWKQGELGCGCNRGVVVITFSYSQ
jgi:hypothetical protein